jgi:EAL domain-containing protein (putative c-di-GMP-specific phosphodiesterase class I)/ActR/RegA family two-component response regulator
MRVLIFDDDEAVGRVLVRAATRMGIDAVAVSRADAFDEQLRAAPPHVVLLDLQLGVTDGVKQLHVLADRKFDGALVLMSGFDTRVLASAQLLAGGLGLNVDSILEKPLRLVSVEQLLDRLHKPIEHLTVERLREAIVNGEMRLHFQPVVMRKPRTVLKLEALIRWYHPDVGVVCPGDFIPLAESDVATIDAMTAWVVRGAVEAYGALAAIGLSVPISVNVSVRNLHNLAFPDWIEQCLLAGDMPAEHLHVEITESAAFGEAAMALDVLSRLRLKGISLSIDDFGTSYASFKVLRQMPFSEIKIDRSFVSEMTVSRDSRAIVKSIVDLAVNMDLDCVAEGVETEDTAGLLEQFGVRTMQGYLIARPMSAAALPAWFANWSRSDVATRHQDSAAESAPDAASTITSAAGDQVPIPGPPS